MKTLEDLKLVAMAASTGVTQYHVEVNGALLAAMIAEIEACRAFDSYDKSQAINSREHVRNFYCRIADRNNARTALDALLNEVNP